jgi:hypothetical protein
MRSDAKSHIHFDNPTIDRVIKLAKTVRMYGDMVNAKIPTQNGMMIFSDAVTYFDEAEDEDRRNHRLSQDALKAYLSGLSLETVRDILALMYLGRNGEFDGIRYVPIRKRLLMYVGKDNFWNNKHRMINHMAGKSRLLDEYLETGLRYIKRAGAL